MNTAKMFILAGAILMLAGAWNVVKADPPTMIVSERSIVPYDIYLCKERAYIKSIIAGRKLGGEAQKNFLMSTFIRQGNCSQEHTYITVKHVDYFTTIPQDDGTSVKVYVVEVETESGTYYSVVRADDVSILGA